MRSPRYFLFLAVLANYQGGCASHEARCASGVEEAMQEVGVAASEDRVPCGLLQVPAAVGELQNAYNCVTGAPSNQGASLTLNRSIDQIDVTVLLTGPGPDIWMIQVGSTADGEPPRLARVTRCHSIEPGRDGQIACNDPEELYLCVEAPSEAL